MFFASDNWAGASPAIAAALAAVAKAPPAPSYGGDRWTADAIALIRQVFEAPKAEVFFLSSGTAANALALAHVTPPWGAVYAHEDAHVAGSECGALEFTGGNKIIGLPGTGGKVTVEALRAAIARARRGDAHSVQPGALSLTNLTECGTLYAPADVAALAAAAKHEGLVVHVDGARLANAIAALGCAPADLTWRAGVDVLSLGATKNGALIAEAIVLFDPARADGLIYRRMRGGHLISKHRVVSAQFVAWLTDGHWLDLAGHANAMARRLADGLSARGLTLAWAPAGNEVFAFLPSPVDAALKEAGAFYHPWPARHLGHPQPVGTTLMRLVCSFATTADEVDRFLAVTGQAMPA
jgi:threonine aldolase